MVLREPGQGGRRERTPVFPFIPVLLQPLLGPRTLGWSSGRDGFSMWGGGLGQGEGGGEGEVGMGREQGDGEGSSLRHSLCLFSDQRWATGNVPLACLEMPRPQWPSALQVQRQLGRAEASLWVLAPSCHGWVQGGGGWGGQASFAGAAPSEREAGAGG